MELKENKKSQEYDNKEKKIIIIFNYSFIIKKILNNINVKDFLKEEILKKKLILIKKI